MTTSEVRPATTDDVLAMAGAIARAFSNDPPMSWVFRDDATRIERLEVLFGAALRELFVPNGHAFTTADVAGVALWEAPGQWRTPEDVTERIAGSVAEVFLPEELDRFLTYIGTLEDRHPAEPEHWYLAVLAVDLERQGQGIGSACMAPMLEHIRREGAAAYLESSNSRNVPLYERHGFRVTDVVDLPEEGPPVYLMWREPTPVVDPWG